MPERSRMTRVERDLEATLRVARWADTHGEPVCPRCYDGEDVYDDPSCPAAAPPLHTYHCRCCRYRFTALTRSALHHCKLDLWQLAQVVLVGPPPPAQITRELGRRTGVDYLAIRRMAQRLTAEEPLLMRWRERMAEAGLTIEKIERAHHAENAGWALLARRRAENARSYQRRRL